MCKLAAGFGKVELEQRVREGHLDRRGQNLCVLQDHGGLIHFAWYFSVFIPGNDESRQVMITPITNAPLRLPGGEGAPLIFPRGVPPLGTRLPPHVHPICILFPETSRRRQTPTPHSRTRVAPPTPSDRGPIRDRVRGREYSHPHPP